MSTSAKKLEGNCESCMMPFKKDPVGSDRENEKYCSNCFSDGKLAYEGTDVREFKKGMVNSMVAHGQPKLKAKFFAYLAGFAPRWKK